MERRFAEGGPDVHAARWVWVCAVALVKLWDSVRFAHSNWFPTLRGWRVMRASAPVRSCGSGSRFNGGGLTTAYPFVRAGLIATCSAVWGSAERARSESTRCALWIMRGGSDSTRSRRWSVRPELRNYWAMRLLAAYTSCRAALCGGDPGGPSCGVVVLGRGTTGSAAGSFGHYLPADLTRRD